MRQLWLAQVKQLAKADDFNLSGESTYAPITKQGPFISTIQMARVDNYHALGKIKI
jgi:hypothetical protein